MSLCFLLVSFAGWNEGTKSSEERQAFSYFVFLVFCEVGSFKLWQEKVGVIGQSKNTNKTFWAVQMEATGRKSFSSGDPVSRLIFLCPSSDIVPICQHSGLKRRPQRWTVIHRSACWTIPHLVFSNQGSMRKARSLSECWLFRVRRSGRRSSSFGKRVLSSGLRLLMRERRAFMRFSCSCSTAATSAIPERSEEKKKKGENEVRRDKTCCPTLDVCANVSILPADTSTTAMKRAISSGSKPKDPNFSLKSNMASSREPIPRALSDASEYVCPLRKVTVLSLGSNSEQNLTIRTCRQIRIRSETFWRKKLLQRSTNKFWSPGCTWKVPDLSSMTWSCWLRFWKPGMLFANSTTSLTAGVKHCEKDSHTSWLERLAGATGQEFRGHAWKGRK